MTRRRLFAGLLALAVATGAGGFLVGDTASAIAQAGQSGGSQMRIGTVTAFDAGSGALTVTVAGTAFTNVPYNPSYLPLLGDTVAVMNTGPTWYVMGSTVNTLARTLPVAQTIDTFQDSADTGGLYVDLPTPGPSVTVTVGASGRVLVMISVNIQAGEQSWGFAAAEVSGANTISADLSPAWVVDFNTTDINVFGNSSAASSTLMTGLNPGPTTFKLKYSATLFNPANHTGFAARSLVVIPY